MRWNADRTASPCSFRTIKRCVTVAVRSVGSADRRAGEAVDDPNHGYQINSRSMSRTAHFTFPARKEARGVRLWTVVVVMLSVQAASERGGLVEPLRRQAFA